MLSLNPWISFRSCIRTWFCRLSVTCEDWMNNTRLDSFIFKITFYYASKYLVSYSRLVCVWVVSSPLFLNMVLAFNHAMYKVPYGLIVYVDISAVHLIFTFVKWTQCEITCFWIQCMGVASSCPCCWYVLKFIANAIQL